jgi:hypothetical protein
VPAVPPAPLFPADPLVPELPEAPPAESESGLAFSSSPQANIVTAANEIDTMRVIRERVRARRQEEGVCIGGPCYRKITITTQTIHVRDAAEAIKRQFWLATRHRGQECDPRVD